MTQSETWKSIVFAQKKLVLQARAGIKILFPSYIAFFHLRGKIEGRHTSWDGSASCNASDGELAVVGYSGSVQSFLALLGVFYHQQFAGAEDSEGIRHVAVTGNE